MTVATMHLSTMRFPLASSHNTYHCYTRTGFGQPGKMIVKPLPTTTTRHNDNDEESSTVSNQTQKKPLTIESTSVFRRRMDASEEQEEMWTLKRATAVFDEYDVSEVCESPSKRLCQELDWEDSSNGDDRPFQLSVSSGQFFLS